MLYFASGYAVIAMVATAWRLCVFAWLARYMKIEDHGLEWVMEFVLLAILWPIVIFQRPSMLFAPWREWESEKLNGKGEYRIAFRELARLRELAPSNVQFFGDCGDFSTSVEFLKEWLAKKEERTPQLDALFDSLSSFSNPTSHTTSVVSGIFSDREAFELVGTGHVAVRCKKCDREIAGVEIVHGDDRGKPGWRSDRYQCPAGHNLVSYRRIHVLMRRQQSTPSESPG